MTLRRVVLTGGTGFVGRALVRRLATTDVDVVLLTRRGRIQSDAHPDLAGLAVVEDHGDVGQLRGALSPMVEGTALVHLATHYVGTPGDHQLPELLESNVAFGARCVHAFVGAGGRAVVNASTFSQRRHGHGYDPMSLYAATKQAFSDILQHYASNAGASVADVELFDTVGTDDPRTKIWGLLVEAARTAQPLETTPGHQVLAPLHVDDAAAAIHMAASATLSSPGGWRRYSAPGPAVVTLRDAVDLLAESVGRSVPVVWGARRYSGNEVFDLVPQGPPPPGWAPRIPLADAFAALWHEAGGPAADHLSREDRHEV